MLLIQLDDDDDDIFVIFTSQSLAQSAGAVEYVDYISAER